MFWGGLKREMEPEELYETLDEHASGECKGFLSLLSKIDGHTQK